ncbi:MAG: hypothetical protein ABIH19_02375, partial [Candidatus Omnitrophota bacterium]
DTIYHPSGEAISGAGSYIAEELTPSPSIPSFDDSVWEAKMADWNTRIDNAGANVSGTSRSEGSGTLNLSSNVNWSGQTLSYRNINTNGYDITGTNWTVKCRYFNLESGSEISSGASNFHIECTREFTMTDAQINASNYTIDCRDLVMNGSSQINSSGNTITSNRDVIMNDTAQIVNSDTINITDDFTMNDSSQISADSLTINCLDIFRMNDSSQISADNITVNVNDDFLVYNDTSITSDNFNISIWDNFDTDGNFNLSGYGYIACSNNNGNIILHSEDSNSGTFTATPSGGSIYFLSGGSMTINSTDSDTNVILNNGCVLYSRNPSSDDDLLRIRNDNTAIDGAEIIAERRIIIQSSADIMDSFIFLDRAGGDSNNYLEITDSGTTVEGTIISMGRDSPSLDIRDSAAITGFVYQYDGVGSRGYARIDGDSTITGSLYIYEMYNNSFGPASITYDADSLPAAWDGFTFPGAVGMQSGTWDGL